MKLSKIIKEIFKTGTIIIGSIFVWEVATPYGVDKNAHDKPQTVEEVQAGLVELGYLGESDIDGICGDKTKRAWNQYSNEHDPKTLQEFEK